VACSSAAQFLTIPGRLFAFSRVPLWLFGRSRNRTRSCFLLVCLYATHAAMWSCRDLVTIRFKGEYNGVVFDDLFKVEEPYFYRMGSENILKVRTV